MLMLTRDEALYYFKLPQQQELALLFEDNLTEMTGHRTVLDEKNIVLTKISTDIVEMIKKNLFNIR